MADDVTITVHVRDLTGPGFNSVNRNINQLQRNANGTVVTLRGLGGRLDDVASSAANAGQNLGGGMGLRGQLIGVAAALGTTLLPTIGAVAPMLTGLAAVGGGAALAMDDLKKKAKELKGPFEEWQKVANKAVAPHTEKAVKSLKGAMKDLTPVIETGADTFGRITEKAARFADSPAFKSSLAKNAEMGSRWVEEFAGSIGRFTQAFLDFGTKSQPALDAWDNLLGGLLDTGLPSMFKELEQGIGGSSQMLSGLGSFLNDSLLPSLGKIAGSFTDAFGPLLGEMLRTAGDALRGLAVVFEGLMEIAKPVARIMADGWHAVVDVFRIGSEVAGSFAKNVGGALLGALLQVAGVDTSGMTGGFTKLSDWVDRNENSLRTAFYSVAQAITDMVITGLEWAPKLFDAFHGTFRGILEGVDLIVSQLADKFGGLPIVGEQFKEWDRSFGTFKDDALAGLSDIGAGLHSLADESIPRASRAKLSMDVDLAEGNLNHIKEQLKDPELTKERRAKLTADKKQAEDALAEAKKRLKDFDGKKATGKIDGNAQPFFGVLGRVLSARVKDKTGRINANTNPFYNAVGGIAGRVVGTSYINVAYRQVGSAVGGIAGLLQADGGIVKYYADGGVRNESHIAQIAPAGSWRVWGEPETGGEAYIPLGPSKRQRSREVAEETVSILGGDVQWFARGGVTKAEAQARREARSELTLSYFGTRAGYRNDEFVHQLGINKSLTGSGGLVDSLNKWRNVILKTTHGLQEARLLTLFKHGGDNLIFHQKALAKVTASLEKARDRLDSLKDAAAQLKSSVSAGIVSEANITKAANAEDSRVTINTVLSQMTASASNAKQFTVMLNQLKKRGLDKGLISEIAQAGVEGGGMETAAAILGGSGAQIKQLNKLRAHLTNQSRAAGDVAADAMYGAGIRAAEGLVKGLKAREDQIERHMLLLAKKMESALKRALGIRSPSKVMEEIGGFTADGFALGIERNRKVQPAWASMLNVPRGGAPGGARAAPAVRGGDRPIVLNVSLGTQEFGQIWVDVGRQEVSTRGGVKATLGRLE
ncbi:hypothetical protein [Streptomyces sp. UG1]|uniref:hypothetical protein n=1 Tax=Streptomyces sp. UG1 TaxID=3417652 RepID=UPI003CE7B5C3